MPALEYDRTANTWAVTVDGATVKDGLTMADAQALYKERLAEPAMLPRVATDRAAARREREQLNGAGWTQSGKRVRRPV